MKLNMRILLIFFTLHFHLCEQVAAQWDTHLVYTDGSEILQCLQTYDQNTLYAGGTSRFFKSVDGGQNWIEHDLVDSDGDPYYVNVFDIHFRNPVEAFLVGNFFLENAYIVLHTVDGGATWQEVYYDYYGIEVATTSIAFGDVNHGIITCKESRILYTTDGGATWIPTYPSLPSVNFYSVDFVNATTAYISGDSTVLKTTDGGLNFQTSLFPGYICSEVQFLDQQNGYVTTMQGQLLKTGSGGSTWQVFEVLPGLEITDLFFTSIDTGYLIESDKMYRTVDGGYSWEFSDLPFYIGDLKFLNSSSVIGVGYKYAFTSSEANSSEQFIPWSDFDLPGYSFACTGKEILLSANNGDAFSYEWLIDGQHYSKSKDTTVVFSSGNVYYDISLQVSNGANIGSQVQDLLVYNSPIEFSFSSEASFDTFCGTKSGFIYMYNTLPDVSYQIKNINNSVIFGPIIGNGGTITYSFTMSSSTVRTAEAFSYTQCDSNYHAQVFNFTQIPFLSNPAFAPDDETPCPAMGTFINLYTSVDGNGYYVKADGYQPYDTTFGTGGPIIVYTGPLVSTSETVYTLCELIAMGNCVKEQGDFILADGGPDPTFNTIPYNTVPGQVVTLMPENTTAVSYAWKMNNGSPPNSTEMMPVVTFLDIDTNKIKLIVEDALGCYDTSEYKIVVANPAVAGTSSTCALFSNGMNYGETYKVGDKVLDFKADKEGNTYVCGYRDTSTNGGVAFMFIRKFDVTGNLLWENLQNGSDLNQSGYSGAYATQMSIDDYGNVYFVANHNGFMIIDGYWLGSYATGFAGKINGFTGICEWVVEPEFYWDTDYYSKWLDIEYIDPNHIYILLGPGKSDEKILYGDGSTENLPNTGCHILVVDEFGHYRKTISYASNMDNDGGYFRFWQVLENAGSSNDIFCLGPQLTKVSSSQLEFTAIYHHANSGESLTFGSNTLAFSDFEEYIVNALMDTSGTWLNAEEVVHYGYFKLFNYVPVCQMFSNIPVYASDNESNTTVVVNTAPTYTGSEKGFLYVDSLEIHSDSMTYICNLSAGGTLKWYIEMPFTRIHQIKWINGQLVIAGNFTSFMLYPNNGNEPQGFTSTNLSDQDIFLMAVDTGGNLLWQHAYGSMGTDRLYLMDYDKCSDYLYFIAASEGSVMVNDEMILLSDEYFTARIAINDDCSSLLCQLATTVSETAFSEEFVIYPNPATDVIRIYSKNLHEKIITITDMSGKNLKSVAWKNNDHLFPIDISDFTEGVFTLAIKSNNEIISVKKIVIIK